LNKDIIPKCDYPDVIVKLSKQLFIVWQQQQHKSL